MFPQNIDDYVETNANISLERFFMQPVSSPKKKGTHFTEEHLPGTMANSPNRRCTSKTPSQSPQRRPLLETQKTSPSRRYVLETPLNTPRRRQLSRRASETSMSRVPPKTPHKKRPGGSQVSSPVKSSGQEDGKNQTGSGGGQGMPIVNLLPK